MKSSKWTREYKRAYSRKYYRKNKVKAGRYNREYYRANKARINATSRAWSRKNQRRVNDLAARRRERVAQFKLVRGCADCGYREHACALDFDHVRGRKAFTIGC